MKKLPFIFLLAISCTDATVEEGIKQLEEKSETHQFQEQKDSLNKNFPKDDTLTSNSTEVTPIKQYYPSYAFSLTDYQGDTTPSKYKLTESIITFFISKNEKEQLAEMRTAGYPIPWWEGRNCGYYEYDESKLSTFLRVADDMGYPNYGFRCEPLDERGREGALTNGIVVMFHGINPTTNEYVKREDMIEILKKYDIYESIQSRRPRYYYTLYKGLNAHEIVERTNRLNEEEIVQYARNSFSDCNGRPHIN